jgi:hypothetical protein
MLRIEPEREKPGKEVKTGTREPRARWRIPVGENACIHQKEVHHD